MLCGHNANGNVTKGPIICRKPGEYSPAENTVPPPKNGRGGRLREDWRHEKKFLSCWRTIVVADRLQTKSKTKEIELK